MDPWIIVAGLSGVVVSMIGFWGKSQVERFTQADARHDQRNDQQTERVIDHTTDIAKLQADLENLKETHRDERNACAELRERMARSEAFQAWAEPLLEKVVEATQQCVAFQARFDERLVTLFKGLGAITARLERQTALV